MAPEPADQPPGRHLPAGHLRVGTRAGGRPRPAAAADRCRRRARDRQDRGGRGTGAGDRCVRPGVAVPELGPAGVATPRAPRRWPWDRGSRSGRGAGRRDRAVPAAGRRPLVAAGAHVTGVLEANRATAIGRTWLGRPAVAARKLGELASYGGAGAAPIGVRYRTAVIAAHGTDRVESVSTARLDLDWNPVPGTRRQVAVDGASATASTPSWSSPSRPVAPSRRHPTGWCGRRRHRPADLGARGVRRRRVTGVGGAGCGRGRGAVAGAAAAHQLGHGTDSARSDSWLLVATAWPPPWPRRTWSATAGAAGSPATRWSAGAGGFLYDELSARPFGPAPPPDRARSGRPRAEPASVCARLGLRPQHRRAARRTTRPHRGRRPADRRTGCWETWPEPCWRNSDREADGVIVAAALPYADAPNSAGCA